MFSQAITALKAARARDNANQAYRRLLEVDEHLLRYIGIDLGDARRGNRAR